MSNLSLYKLTEDHQSLLSQLYDYETGEVNSEVEEQLAASFQTIEKKCLSVASYIQVLESEKEQLEYFKRQIKEREEAYNAKIDRMERYLQSNMERNKIGKIECPYFTVKIKENPYSTEILDESLIPSDFINHKEVVKIESRPDKVRIKEQVLQTGVQVPGCYVSRKKQLKIEIGNI